jgi:hypothetical protein
MRCAALICGLSVALYGCAAGPRVPAITRSMDMDNGVGSQFGNYEMLPAGETHDAAGDRCVLFNWDRPLNKNWAIRYSTQSCESKEHPIWMNTTAYTRSVIPLSQSNLKNNPNADAP